MLFSKFYKRKSQENIEGIRKGIIFHLEDLNG